MPIFLLNDSFFLLIFPSLSLNFEENKNTIPISLTPLEEFENSVIGWCERKKNRSLNGVEKRINNRDRSDSL